MEYQKKLLRLETFIKDWVRKNVKEKNNDY